MKHEKKTILVGLGPNALRTYVPYFIKYHIDLRCVVEMESRVAEITELLKTHQLEAQIICVPEEDRNSRELSKTLADQLREVIRFDLIEYAIINSEAKSHYSYLRFFMEEKLKILLEKPIIAPLKLETFGDVEHLAECHRQICELVDATQAQCAVMCQRRLHYGYELVKSILRDAIHTYGIPITEIYLNHCDGNWMLPQDLFYENHPYQYGYGKLYHSGYHFVDLLAQLLSLNQCAAASKHPTQCSVSTDVHSVWDETAIMNETDLMRLFHTDSLLECPQSKNTALPLRMFGEKNIYSQLSFRNSEGKVITVAQLSITQMGFSRRAWLHARKDHYKGNGRIRHEYLNVQMGPLMNIRVSSYQSKEVHDRTFAEYTNGGLDHFDIEIFRNSDLIGGKPYQKLDYRDILNGRDSYGLNGLNEISRVRMLERFFDDTISEVSDIRNHYLGMEIMHALTKGIIAHKHGMRSIDMIDLSHIFEQNRYSHEND